MESKAPTGNLKVKILNNSSDQLTHTLVLLTCLGMLVMGALLMPPRAPSDPLALGDVPLPLLCGFRRATGLDCPGCGLTRSVTATLHGQLNHAVDWNPVGPLVAVYALLQALRHGLWLAWPDWRLQREKRWGRALDRAILVLVGLLLLQWLWRTGPELWEAVSARFR